MAEVTQGEVAPVEVVVEDTPALESAPEVEVAAEPTEPPAPPTEKTFTQKELDRIVARERREYQRLSREAEDRAYERYQREKPVQPQAQPVGKPRFEDFKDKSPEEYVEALTEWKLEQREAKRSEETKVQREEREQQETARYYFTKLKGVSEKFPDIQARLGELPDDSFTRPMLDFVVDTEHGGLVGDHIANNPAEAQKIAAMTPAQQIVAMHSLALKLAAPPKVSSAPAPIKPNGGNAPVEKRLEDADYDDFVKIRRRQIAAKNSR